jgi:hypothetical protein
MTHHLPPASQATARGVDHGWNDDDDREATMTTVGKQTNGMAKEVGMVGGDEGMVPSGMMGEQW